MMAGTDYIMQPTFEGYVSSTLDALVLFEACLTGQLNHVPRRPHDRERQDLIRSGNIFIYEEHASGIKRWTDGVSWSPSRILGNFLIYRELEKPFPPGEKKRALKKSKKMQHGVSKNGTPSRPNLTLPLDHNSGGRNDAERALIGSLVDSYDFKEQGLVKKTISISLQGVAHHLVSYYNVEDVTAGRLNTPTRTHALQSTVPRPALLVNQSFRSPIDEVEYTTGDDAGHPGSLPMYVPATSIPGPYIPSYPAAPSFGGYTHTHNHQPYQQQQQPQPQHHHPQQQPSPLFPAPAVTTAPTAPAWNQGYASFDQNMSWPHYQQRNF